MPTNWRLVDRDEDLSLLRQTYQSATQGHPSTVVIAGEAGIGKTRLVEELATDIAEQNARIIVGTCSPVTGARIPYGPVVTLLRDLVRTAAPFEEDDWIVRAWRAVAPLMHSDARGSEANPTSLATLFAGFTEVLSFASRQQSLVIVVEDFHWIDSASADLIGFLARRLKHDRLMLVLTIRTPISPRSLARAALAEIRRLPNTVDMNLAPITNGGIITLVNDMVTKPAPALLGRIVAICDGNPFFAIHFALHGNPRSISPGLRDLLLSSLDDIEPTQRSILAFLAITGDLTTATSAQYLHTLFPDFDRTIRYFVSKGLVEVAEERIGFHHALLREIVLDDLLPSERSVGHAQAADFLLSSEAALDLGRSGEIARHLLGAGRNAQAIRFAVRGARQAASVWAFADARELFETVRRLWGLVEEPESIAGIRFPVVLEEAALVSRWCGQLDEALQLLETASGVSDLTDNERARIEHSRGVVLWATGDFEGSLRAYKTADALLANDSEDGLRASVLAALAFGLLVTGQAEQSLTTAGIAVRLAAAIGAVRDELHSAITAAVAKASLGRVDEATRELLGCLQQARNLDDPELVMRCYGNLTYTHAVAGRPERVAEVGAEGAAYCRRYRPVTSFASPMMSNYVVALNVLGRWDQAIEIADETLADATADSVVIELHSIVAVIAARRGDVDQSNRRNGPRTRSAA